MVKALKVLTAAVLAIGLYAQPVAAAPKKIVLIYGDSMLYESSSVIAARFAAKDGWTYQVRAEPGVAPCHWLAQLKSDLSTLHPKVVMLETMGNPVTPCLRAGTTTSTDAYYAKYRTDFDTFFRASTAAGAKMIFLRPIPTTSASANHIHTKLSAIAKTEAAKFHGVSMSTIGYYPITDAQHYAKTQPCLSNETVAMGCDENTGEIVVRAPDGVHLCPTGLPDPTTACPVYSSGERRFGTDVVHAALYPPFPVNP